MANIDWKNLGFSYLPVNSHVQYTWRDGVWDSGTLVAEPYLKLHIAATALHYGQAAFEGLKAFRQKDGGAVLFRPQANAKRMVNTALRTCMPPVPEEMFLEACKRVVAANLEFLPPYGTGGSLYVRPLLIGSGPRIGVAPADEYVFLVLVTPVGPYYTGGLKPVKAIVYDEYDRAAPHGVGHVKVAGNYAASLYPHIEAKHAGFPVELYLDAKEHKWVEEFATSNFIGITRDGRYVTPKSESILPSITNMTLQTLAADMKMKVEARPVPFDEIASFAEVGACGTAVVVTPVSQITRGSLVIRTGSEDGCGPVLEKLYKEVQAGQYGEKEDAHGWCVSINA
jgi:branched-chain amino acid aminotransferase